MVIAIEQSLKHLSETLACYCQLFRTMRYSAGSSMGYVSKIIQELILPLPAMSEFLHLQIAYRKTPRKTDKGVNYE